MARRPSINEPEKLRVKLVELLQDFKSKLNENDLREQVLALIPANHLLRDLGSSLIPNTSLKSARDRILAYFKKYPTTIITSEEIAIVAGISEYTRRIRELRVEFGWPILNGTVINDLIEQGDVAKDLLEKWKESELKVDSYILIEDKQDRDAAFRWNTANVIRNSDLSTRNKLLEYFRKNVGKQITGEELKYIAKNNSEWARRIRELRTEFGWPIITRNTGSDELPVGVYLLIEDRQAPIHDRKIPDPVRVHVLKRDSFKCQKCSWSFADKIPGDPRNLLELHHKHTHVEGGPNSEANLITLCNTCHDDVHRRNISESQIEDYIKSDN